MPPDLGLLEEAGLQQKVGAWVFIWEESVKLLKGFFGLVTHVARHSNFNGCQ
jgi:hypothetical protein